MREIIRIEDSMGIGICRSTKLTESLEKIIFRVMSKKFPTPLNEHGIKRPIKNYEYCAFRSLRQLKSLYSKEELQILQENGFEIQLLTVSNYTLGRRQVLFRKCDIINKKIIKI